MKIEKVIALTCTSTARRTRKRPTPLSPSQVGVWSVSPTIPGPPEPHQTAFRVVIRAVADTTEYTDCLIRRSGENRTIPPNGDHECVRDGGLDL